MRRLVADTPQSSIEGISEYSSGKNWDEQSLLLVEVNPEEFELEKAMVMVGTSESIIFSSTAREKKVECVW